jgi:hypothetical protein
MQFICESIDEALPAASMITGREIYLRGFDRYEAAHFDREMKRKRRELEAALPLFVPAESEVIEDFAQKELPFLPVGATAE